MFFQIESELRNRFLIVLQLPAEIIIDGNGEEEEALPHPGNEQYLNFDQVIGEGVGPVHLCLEARVYPLESGEFLLLRR